VINVRIGKACSDLKRVVSKDCDGHFYNQLKAGIP
jgi:hypothetical protein